MPWAIRGLRDGTITTRWPRRPDPYADGLATGVDVVPDGARDPGALAATAAACPTGAITVDTSDDGAPRVRLDRGRCILCGRCVDAAPDTFAWHRGPDVASLGRETLVVGDVEPDPDALADVRAALAAKVRHLGRSVHVRHVDAGSDGADEWEVQALFGPVYDAHRLGVYLTASPRHADVLLVTGIGAAGMAEPLRRTREAMPDPVVVIATGTDAASGGLVGPGGYTGGEGVGARLDVDVWVPGSPASPFALLHALLLAVGRLP